MMNSNTKAIVCKLIEKAEFLLSQPRKKVCFTKEPEADEFVNNIENYPHGFVLGCLMDQSGEIGAEKAWRIPYIVAKSVGGFDFERFQRLDALTVNDMFVKQTLHRYPTRMAEFFYMAIQDIACKYHGDASEIWRNTPSSATVVRRFLEFKGAGPKVATMGANILSRELKVPMSDKFSIDISVDIHTRRVFKRLRLVRNEASDWEIIYTARELNPSYPGIFDLPTWEIGRNWCRPQKPTCQKCYMQEFCPSKMASIQTPYMRRNNASEFDT